MEQASTGKGRKEHSVVGQEFCIFREMWVIWLYALFRIQRLLH